jgi:hypothetical protein
MTGRGEPIRSVAIAVGTRGDVLVAWDARGTIRARYARSFSAGFQPIEITQGLSAALSRRPSPIARRSRLSRDWIDERAEWRGSFNCCPRQLIPTLLGHWHFWSALLTSRVIQVTPGIVNVDSLSGFCKTLARTFR